MCVVFFLVFTPWLYVRVIQPDAATGEPPQVLVMLPFGFSLWWGSLCCLLVGAAALAAALDISWPLSLLVRTLALWFYMVAAIGALVLPIIGYLTSTAGYGIPAPLETLAAVRPFVELLSVPLAASVVPLIGVVAGRSAWLIWKERQLGPQRDHPTQVPPAANVVTT